MSSVSDDVHADVASSDGHENSDDNESVDEPALFDESGAQISDDVSAGSITPRDDDAQVATPASVQSSEGGEVTKPRIVSREIEDESDVIEKGQSDGNEQERSPKNQDRQLNESDSESDESVHDQPQSSTKRVVLSSDDEEDNSSPKETQNDSDSDEDDNAEVGVGELMTNIFGEDSDDEKESNAGERSDYKQQKVDDDDSDSKYNRDDDDGNVWDFDVMVREKKLERRRPKHRRRDGSIDVSGSYDDQIRTFINEMKVAAKNDRHSNTERKPAVQKRKMLPQVKALLIKHDLMEALIDNGMMSVVSEWLAPLPDKSLPALEIRTDLLKILQSYNHLEPGTLKQSGLGRAVMLLYKHPRETKDNKTLAARLISEWSRPIFQLDTDFRSMSRNERIQRDLEQLPETKRRRLSVRSDSEDVDKELEPRPGDKGFIMRARVPRPSQRDYVVRPKSSVEGQFRGATKNRSNSRFDRTQREFRERTRQRGSARAVGVSINRISM